MDGRDRVYECDKEFPSAMCKTKLDPSLEKLVSSMRRQELCT